MEVSDAIFSDNYSQLEAIERNLKQQLYRTLSLTPKIKLVEPNSIERTAGKAKRVIDMRDSVKEG